MGEAYPGYLPIVDDWAGHSDPLWPCATYGEIAKHAGVALPVSPYDNRWRGGVVTELKPLECPYCGGQVLAVVESVRAGQIVGVECDDCGAAWAPDGGPVSGPVRVETRRAAQ